MALYESLGGLRRTRRLVIFVPFKYWTISKNLTETDEAVISVVAFVSERWWKKLMSNLASVGATVVKRKPALKATYERLLTAVKKTRK